MSGPASRSARDGFLRRREGQEAEVGFEELFFDLVYAFAVTQVSHTLLGDLTLGGFARAAVLWFGVWLGWQYTCWVTNWFDPGTPAIRCMVFGLMLVILVMAAALPEAFGERGLVFAACYALMQVGRTTFVVAGLGRGDPLRPNFERMLGWNVIAAALWIAGGFAEGAPRMPLWAAAIACEYVAPMFGFALPGLGRSRTDDWTIHGAHLAERCQCFVLVALGEAVLATGATLAERHGWTAPVVSAFAATFLGSLAMWWIYFGVSGKDGSAVIASSDDPGAIGARFHYVHVMLLAGIIATAVGNDLAIAHPDGGMTPFSTAVVIGGPALFLLGSASYKRVVYRCWPPSHGGGLLALVLLTGIALRTDLLITGGLTTAVMLAVGFWEGRLARPPAPAGAGVA